MPESRKRKRSRQGRPAPRPAATPPEAVEPEAVEAEVVEPVVEETASDAASADAAAPADATSGDQAEPSAEDADPVESDTVVDDDEGDEAESASGSPEVTDPEREDVPADASPTPGAAEAAAQPAGEGDTESPEAPEEDAAQVADAEADSDVEGAAPDAPEVPLDADVEPHSADSEDAAPVEAPVAEPAPAEDHAGPVEDGAPEPSASGPDEVETLGVDYEAELTPAAADEPVAQDPEAAPHEVEPEGEGEPTPDPVDPDPEPETGAEDNHDAAAPAPEASVDDSTAAPDDEQDTEDGEHEDAPSGPAVGRERLRKAVSRPGRSQIVVAVLLAALGFAAAVQVRDSGSRGSYEGLRESELIEILDGLTGTAERARDEIERLERTESDLKSETSGRKAALEEAQQRARTLNIMAGYVKVTGPGLRITITPGADAVSVGALLDSVQELRTAGAEAIEVNDQIRVVAQSHFDSSNGVITLDGVTLEAPYVIEVIGDPHVLRTGMTFSGGPQETLELEDGASVEIEDVTAVDIESVRAPKRLDHTSSASDE